MKIIQIVSNYIEGDAISKVVDTMDKSIKSLGIQTELFRGSLTEEIIESGTFNENDMIMYHLSVRIDPLLYFVKCKKILIFHNITTPELLIGFDVEGPRLDCEAGLYELKKTPVYFEYAIAASDYSKKLLIEYGWDTNRIITLPYVVKFDELSDTASSGIIKKYNDGKTNFTFFGRLFPNKKQEDIIKCFEMYKRKYNNNSRLILVGSGKAPKYEMLLKKYTKDLGISDDVIFTGFVNQEEYIAYYKISDCFICMSEHEGFCIPLVEAMFFDVPVIAYNSTAIPNTLDGAGILLNSKEPEIISNYMNKVITDKEYRNLIINKQRKRVNFLKSDTYISQYANEISRIINESSACNNCIDDCKHFYFGKSINTLKLPTNFKEKSIPIVVYGIGKWGKQLCDHLSKFQLKSDIVLCDGKNAFGKYDKYEIQSVENTIKTYSDGFWIITPEKKETAIEMILLLIRNNISTDRIATYDGYQNIVSMIEG